MTELRRISLLGVKEDAVALRQKTADFHFPLFTKTEIRALVRDMRATMKAAEGVGLSANQIGLNMSMFVARVEGKFYAVFNPKIVKVLQETYEMEEGCLSVPGQYGLVERPRTIWVLGQNADGKKIKIKAWGFLARVFQHEVDHLNGVLFVDKAKKIYTQDSRFKVQGL